MLLPTMSSLRLGRRNAPSQWDNLLSMCVVSVRVAMSILFLVVLSSNKSLAVGAGANPSLELQGVFGRLYHLRFTFPFEISHLIQAGFRFYSVFGRLYLLGKAPLCGVFGSLYGLRLDQN
jgi:hypothetical protein